MKRKKRKLFGNSCKGNGGGYDFFLEKKEYGVGRNFLWRYPGRAFASEARIFFFLLVHTVGSLSVVYLTVRR